MNWATKYAIIDAKITRAAFWNTRLYVELSMGELGIALKIDPSHKNNSTRTDAIKPEKTTKFAFFLPKISDRISVTKNVIG